MEGWQKKEIFQLANSTVMEKQRLEWNAKESKVRVKKTEFMRPTFLFCRK